ncbi:hypothetical protein [Microbacterium sp. NPDC089696]|uniref:hypothetical protein n=1 Tax=Microbacterium sp. NPDC089696 TaxID=3364199 RepID=UPI00382D3342
MRSDIRSSHLSYVPSRKVDPMYDVTSGLEDLFGTVDDRQKRLAALPAESLSAEWLRRQLDSALDAWAVTQTEADIARESHADY